MLDWSSRSKIFEHSIIFKNWKLHDYLGQSRIHNWRKFLSTQKKGGKYKAEEYFQMRFIELNLSTYVLAQ
jgi:hypothetical protein